MLCRLISTQNFIRYYYKLVTSPFNLLWFLGHLDIEPIEQEVVKPPRRFSSTYGLLYPSSLHQVCKNILFETSSPQFELFIHLGNLKITLFIHVTMEGIRKL